MGIETIRLWERQDGESDQSFEAFEKYRLYGQERSLARVAETLGKAASLIERWSGRDNWKKRVWAWDRHEARDTNEKIIAGTAKMRERHIKQAMNMQIQAAKRINSMTDEEIKSLKPSDVVAIARLGAEMEMKARSVSPEEVAGAERDDAPVFQIHFTPVTPADMLPVQLGEYRGFIPKDQRERFMADHPGGVVIQ